MTLLNVIKLTRKMFLDFFYYYFFFVLNKMGRWISHVFALHLDTELYPLSYIKENIHNRTFS